jgi:hypothetical protein
MATTSTLLRRFEELTSQLAAVAATKRHMDGTFTSGEYVDSQMLTNWRVKARNLLSMACGPASEHYKDFVEAEKGTPYGTTHSMMLSLKAVFEAAREDYEGGYLNSLRNLVQAEVFSHELDQASALLEAGYATPAAVVAGVVLETTLRELCQDEGLGTGKLDKMNADLAKAGRYSLLIQKRITALADIRNNAAHGFPDKFTRQDVRDMISYVEGFVGEQL